MLKKMIFKICLIVMLCLFISSCLTTEFKEYRISVNPDGSGQGSIKFVNIVSEDDEGKDVTKTDFDDLISNYINGSTFENDNPHYNVIKKDLFEEDGVLYGLVEFTFSDLTDIGFYHYKNSDCAPIMYYMGALSETLVETNGEYLGTDVFPVIVWEPGTNEFFMETTFNCDMSNAHSLLTHYDLWKETQ